MAKYTSTKTYGHNIGLSAVFRQPHADHSHCRFLHGYSLQFKFVFGCNELDHRNWCVDFGGLKPLKQWLEDTFDHQTVIDSNDPMKDELLLLETKGLAQITHQQRLSVASRTSLSAKRQACSANFSAPTPSSCECAEHGANSAIYEA